MCEGHEASCSTTSQSFWQLLEVPYARHGREGLCPLANWGNPLLRSIHFLPSLGQAGRGGLGQARPPNLSVSCCFAAALKMAAKWQDLVEAAPVPSLLLHWAGRGGEEWTPLPSISRFCCLTVAFENGCKIARPTVAACLFPPAAFAQQVFQGDWVTSLSDVTHPMPPPPPQKKIFLQGWPYDTSGLPGVMYICMWCDAAYSF